MKNKFNFFLSALLVLLFGMGLNTCSYAVLNKELSNGTSVTIDMSLSEEIFEQALIFWKENVDKLNLSTAHINRLNNLTSGDLLIQYNKILDNFESLIYELNIDSDINYKNLILMIDKYDSGNLYIYFLLTNNQMSNLEFIHIYGDNSTTVHEIINYNNLKTYIQMPTSGTKFYPWSVKSTYSISMHNTYSNFEQGESLINIPNLFGLGGQANNTIYYSNLSYADQFKPYILTNYYINPNPPIHPDLPSGDESGETIGGTTGTITNPSGDTTGKVDLSGIENSLNNIENKIPTSGDIKDSQVQGNKEFWGSSDDIDPEDFENELENNFDGIMESLSGELTQNQIFESLQGAENGFLNFFKEEQNEQFYDLAFSWPDVEFMGGVLIPAGGINISEMCREIPELETLRSYIRVIFNFTVAVALIKQIYNLILSTLGIDNPYLYEDYDEVTSINEDTGEYKQTAVRRKKIYNRRR